MFASLEVVALFFAGVTRQASLRNVLWGLVLERDDFRGVGLFNVGFARAMARLATGYFSLPTADPGELGMGCMRERFELVLMTVFASITSDVVALVG